MSYQTLKKIKHKYVAPSCGAKVYYNRTLRSLVKKVENSEEILSVKKADNIKEDNIRDVKVLHMKKKTILYFKRAKIYIHHYCTHNFI